MRGFEKTALVILAVCVAGYAVTVLAYVASSPDIRIRCLMSDPPPSKSAPEKSTPVGVVIRDTPGLEFKGEQPKPGDTLIRVGRKDVHTYLDFIQQVSALRSKAILPGGRVTEGTDPSELSAFLPALVETPDGKHFVEIEFIRADADHDDPLTSYVRVHSIPLGEIVLSVVWFTLQLAVFTFAALAFWNRSYDRSSRLFFLTCLATTGAYVGGFHWWVIVGNLWLNIPFTLCAILVPPVTLHFFLVFPRPKRFFSQYPAAVLVGLYTIPILAAIGVVFAQVTTYRATIALGEPSFAAEAMTGAIASILAWLKLLRLGIYGYIGVAGIYFFLSLVTVRSSLPYARNPMERGQLQWIWRACQLATLFVGYTLYLAISNQEAFALGAARLPMFLASLCFMLAYAVGILRYRLMVIDQLQSRGILYYTVSYSLTLVFSLFIGLSSLSPQLLNISLSQQQALTVMVALMLGVILLLWIRDLFQRMIDRQFFREKYQLDRALRRMNRAISDVATPEALAEMMLSSCRDVLDIEHAAIYLRTSSDGAFQLLATQGELSNPLQISADDMLTESLQQGGSFQRVTPGSREELSSMQSFLRTMHADLVHILEADSHVVGLVLLGKKTNSSSFTAEDLTFLNALGQITNVALHSAKIDQELLNLNEELQRKTDTINNQKRQLVLLQSELTDVQNVDEPFSVGSNSLPDFHSENIKGSSPSMQAVLATARKVANSDSTVLVRGESGTGKELLAQTLHDNSLRRTGPMVRVHCASLSPSLLESELFGHVKGAFTGADRDREGRFAMANGGTLFLDEIGDISLETQVKLLRVLQERSFEPVGGTKTIHVDVRLVTATHQNLEQLIAEEKFREDLYYRLNVISMTLPPLRERHDDIFRLALHFLNRSANRAKKRISFIDDLALAALERYSWPGNIRELENAIERAVVLAEKDRILLDDLPMEVVQASQSLEWSSQQLPSQQLPSQQRAPQQESPLPRHSVIANPKKRKPLPDFLESDSVDHSPSSENDFVVTTSTPDVPEMDNTNEQITDEQLTNQSLPEKQTTTSSQQTKTVPQKTAVLPKTVRPEDIEERDRLLQALHHCDGNKAKAARELGLPRSTYYSRLKKYGID